MVLGFCINDDGTRLPMEYSSHEDRAWSESSDLVEHGHYAEAKKKLDEYYDINGGFIRKKEYDLILKVEVGFLNVKLSATNIENCVDAWSSALFWDSGRDVYEFAAIADEIIEHYKRFYKIPVEYDNFELANAEQTVKLLEFMVKAFLVPAREYDVHLDCDCAFVESVVLGIRHLVEKGEKPKAHSIHDKVVKAGYKRFMERHDPLMERK